MSLTCANILLCNYAVALCRTVQQIILGFAIRRTMLSVYLLTYLPHPNPCFALGSHLDHLLDERSVVPAWRGYGPLIKRLSSLRK